MTQKKKIVVTGGSGKAGRACVNDLLASGYDVLVVDRVAPQFPPPSRKCPSIVADLTDYGQAIDALSDATIRKWNLWGYIDARDAAQAIRLSIESPMRGAHVYIIANGDTVMNRSNESLLDEVFPNVPRRNMGGPNDSLLSIEKARRELGYAPQFSWKGEPNIS